MQKRKLGNLDVSAMGLGGTGPNLSSDMSLNGLSDLIVELVTIPGPHSRASLGVNRG